MSLRIFSAVASAGLLVACSTESPAPEGEMIDCAIGPGAELSGVCTLEQIDGDRIELFLVHHPDGSFRRLGFDRNTLAWTAMDGAADINLIEERTSAHSLDGYFLFELGGDKYRIPWQVLGSGE